MKATRFIAKLLMLSSFMGCTAAQAVYDVPQYDVPRIDFSKICCSIGGPVIVKKGDLFIEPDNDYGCFESVEFCDIFLGEFGIFKTSGAKANYLSNDSGITIVRNVLELNKFSQSPTGTLFLRFEDGHETGLRVKSAFVSGNIVFDIDKKTYPKVKAVYGSGKGHRDLIQATKIVFAPSNGEPATFGTFDDVEVRAIDNRLELFPFYDHVYNRGSVIFPRINTPLLPSASTRLVPYKNSTKTNNN